MRNVVGLFETRAEAEGAIERLKGGGVGLNSISVAMKDTRASDTLAEATGAHDLSGEGAATGAISGAAVGTLAGLALAGSTFALPGVGIFLVGGPLVAGLTGAGIGAASGGLLGALIGAGIPEHEAEHFTAGLEQGHIFVSTEVPDDQVKLVEKVFDEEGSRRTHTAGSS